MKKTKATVHLSRAIESDLAQILTLFSSTIDNVCNKDYSQNQIEAWKASALEKGKWLKKISNQYFITAKEDSKLLGFGSIEAGHLDLLYVHKDHQRKGIARMIYQELLTQAKTSGQSKITVDASLTALPFFSKQGFEKVKENHFFLRGELITNFHLEKSI